jgi:hypothetical protein
MAELRRNSKNCILLVLVILTTLIVSCGDDPVPRITDPGDSDTTNPGDTTPPQPVSDPVLTYSLSEEQAFLEWTAPADDILNEPVSRYEIRFSYTPQFKMFWDLGIIYTSPPVPGQPGITQQVVIDRPVRGTNLYAAVKAYDENDNPSQVDSVASVHIPGYTLSGQCLNALTGQPIPNLEVKVAANYLRTSLTDAEGRFSSSDLAAGAASVSIKTGQADIEYHPQVKVFSLSDDLHYSYYCIPLLPVESPNFDNLLVLFKLLTRTDVSQPSTILAQWRQRPVKCYVPEFVNTNDLDYYAFTVTALQRWEQKAQQPLFTLVDAPPDTGIVFVFKPASEMGTHLGITIHTYDDEDHPLIDQINILNSFSSTTSLYRILLHEIGHTIQFGHVPFGSFIMYPKQPLPPDISQDETDALKLLLALPIRLNMANYDENYP